MTDTLTELEFRLLDIPATMDEPGGAAFAEMVRVRNITYSEISGHNDDHITPEELLPHYQSDENEIRLLWLVLVDGRAVGRVGVDLPIEGQSKVAFFLVQLLREVWDQGIGARAYQLVERIAREHGRSVLQSWAEHPDALGDRLEPPTGFGSVPAQDHAARYFVRHGFTLEQVERNSGFDLQGSFAEVERLLGVARAASTDYRLVSWFAPTPAEYVDGYALMKARMVTDAPSAAMEYDEETWDAARLAQHDARYTDVGRTLHVMAAQHIATGELCAFNELIIGKDTTEASHQEDTLVLKNHRGHKLGMLVKCENLLAWRDIAPDSPRVVTFNAEENRPMLDINEALGFVPIAYIGAWKKVLDD